MYSRIFKRILDVILATIAIFVLSPLFIPVMLVLLFTGEHYIFYLQKRVGYKNKAFLIIKFATMLKESPNLGTGSLTLRNDPRVLPIGVFLRKTKINELPQLFNVILGNMSVVGPRPHMEVDFLKFPEHIQTVICNSKPGITGIGSIIFRDEEKWISNAQGDKHKFYKTKIAPYKGELEIWYQNNLSLLTDLKLIFLTIWVIINPGSKLVFHVFKDLPSKPDFID